MKTVLRACPYDPGPLESHGLKSYRFWHNLEIDENLSDDQKQHQAVLVPLSNTLASVLLLLQFFIQCFLERVKKLVVTVKIYPLPIQNEKNGQKEKQLDTLEEGVPKHDAGITSSRADLRAIKISPDHLKEKTHIFPYFDCVRFDNVADACVSTTFATAIFEVSNGGLQHLLKDIQMEMRKIYESPNDLANGHGMVIACCDAIWSVPSKFRSYWTETALNNELGQCVRINNQNVYDLICSSYLGLRRVGLGGTVQRAECDQSGRAVHAGFYRHYYPELMQLAHKRAAEDHQRFWNFDPSSTDIKMDWSSIGDLECTSVVALNFVILKF